MVLISLVLIGHVLKYLCFTSVPQEGDWPIIHLDQWFHTKTERLTSISSFSRGVFSSVSFGPSAWLCCSSWSVCILILQRQYKPDEFIQYKEQYADIRCQVERKQTDAEPVRLCHWPVLSPLAPRSHQTSALQPGRHWTRWRFHGCSPAPWL